MRLELAPWSPVGRDAAIATIVGIAALALWMASDGDGYLRVLDDANLAFHEAGHIFFGVFGATPGLYGGTLGQLVFPAVVAGTGTWRREPVMTAVGAAWAGQNVVNVARYVADARRQELPLVGGGEHDWLHILTRWGALDADTDVAAVFRALGWALVLGAAAWIAWRWRRGDDAD